LTARSSAEPRHPTPCLRALSCAVLQLCPCSQKERRPTRPRGRAHTHSHAFLLPSRARATRASTRFCACEHAPSLEGLLQPERCQSSQETPTYLLGSRWNQHPPANAAIAMQDFQRAAQILAKTPPHETRRDAAAQQNPSDGKGLAIVGADGGFVPAPLPTERRRALGRNAAVPGGYPKCTFLPF